MFVIKQISANCWSRLW